MSSPLAVNFQQPTRAPELVPTTGDTSFQPTKKPKGWSRNPPFHAPKIKNGNVANWSLWIFLTSKYSPVMFENGGYVTVTWYMAFQKLLVVTSRQSLTNLDPIWWWIFLNSGKECKYFPAKQRNQPHPNHSPRCRKRTANTWDRDDTWSWWCMSKNLLYVHMNTEHMKTCVFM